MTVEHRLHGKNIYQCTVLQLMQQQAFLYSGVNN